MPGGQGSGGSAFEVGKKQAGRGKERNGRKKAGGQCSGGSAFEAQQKKVGRGRK